MANNTGGGLLRGAPWNSTAFEGIADPPFELSPQQFGDLASELAEAQHQRKLVHTTNPSFTMSAAAAIGARNNSGRPPTSAINNMPPPPPQPQSSQGNNNDPGQDQAATHISRLYNHMLTQLPAAVQHRAQQHLIMRTANVSKSGVPVVQATMLVQQELLPLMQQAFMRLQQAGAINGGGANTTNPATVGANIGVYAQQRNNANTSLAGAGGGAVGLGGSGGVSANGMAHFAMGKAAAAPAIAATEAVIQQHQQQTRARHQMQVNDALLQQQQQQRAAADAQFEFNLLQQQQKQLQHADRQRQHAAFTQQQQQLQQLQHLQAMQARHMQAAQQGSNGVGAATGGNGLPARTQTQAANQGHRVPSPPTEGPAQGIRRQQGINNIAANSIAVAVAPHPAVISLQNNTNSNTNGMLHPHRNSGTALDNMDNSVGGGGTGTPTAAAALYAHQQQQHKRQRTAPNSSGNQLINQWSELFDTNPGAVINRNNLNSIHIITAGNAGLDGGGNIGGGAGLYGLSDAGGAPEPFYNGNGGIGLNSININNTLSRGGGNIPLDMNPILPNTLDPPNQMNLPSTTAPLLNGHATNNNGGIATNNNYYNSYISNYGYLNNNNTNTTTTTTTTSNGAIGFDKIDNAVGIAAISRGKAASAKMQAKEATQRYGWTAGMLGEIFKATPVDETGLLKQEQKNGVILTSAVAVAGRSNGGDGSMYAPLPSSRVVEGTEGQRMLLAAAERIHQGVVVSPGTTNTKASNGVSKEEILPLVPVSLTVKQLQLASNTVAKATDKNAVGRPPVSASLVTEEELLGVDTDPPLQLGNIQ